MAQIISTTEQNHSLLIETKYITILAAYFQPNETAIDIIDELGQQITWSKTDKPLIIAGDFNCRLDVPNHKIKLVLESLQEGLFLLNDRNVPTYICHNGKSTIDISLTRGSIKGEIKLIWEANHTPIRKHIPMNINIQCEWKTPNKQEN